jgi:hypothetical protein
MAGKKNRANMRCSGHLMQEKTLTVAIRMPKLNAFQTITSWPPVSERIGWKGFDKVAAHRDMGFYEKIKLRFH